VGKNSSNDDKASTPTGSDEANSDGKSRRSWRRRITASLVAAAGAVLVFLAANLVSPLFQQHVLARINRFINEKTDSDPLFVSASWPNSPGCDTATRVAVPEGGPTVESIPFTLNEDPRVTVVNAGGASWMRGSLRVTLRAQEGKFVTIDTVRVQVLRNTPDVRLSSVIEVDSGCGGEPLATHLQFDLDKSNMTVVQGDESTGSRITGPTLSGITVTQEEPFHFTIEAVSCSAAYEWVVWVEYSAGSRSYSKKIPIEGASLRSVGGVAGVPIYGIRPSRDGTGRDISRTGRMTQADSKAKADCEPK
jgi:hypothetical protein